MDIPPLICFCGRYLSTEKLLGHYIQVFRPSIKSTEISEIADETRDYFINTLGLHSNCCWNKMQTVYDPIKISLIRRSS